MSDVKFAIVHLRRSKSNEIFNKTILLGEAAEVKTYIKHLTQVGHTPPSQSPTSPTKIPNQIFYAENIPVSGKSGFEDNSR